MSNCSVGAVYQHMEEGFTVTVTEIRKKILGTDTKPIEKFLISFTKNDDGTKMSTEQSLFCKHYQAV